MDANKPLSTWYETGKPCPECGTKMNSDGRVYYCPGCEIEIPARRSGRIATVKQSRRMNK